MALAKLSLSLVVAALLLLASAAFAQDAEAFQAQCQDYIDEELKADTYNLKWVAQCESNWTTFENWIEFDSGAAFLGIWESTEGEVVSCGRITAAFGYILKRQMAGDLVAHLHALPCEDTQGGGHWKLNTSIPTAEEDNEFWLQSFVAGPQNFTSAMGTERYAPADPKTEAPSFVIHDESPKMLCCNLVWTEVGVDGASEDGEDGSTSEDGAEDGSASNDVPFKLTQCLKIVENTLPTKGGLLSKSGYGPVSRNPPRFPVIVQCARCV
ncbi:hypothetical protein QOT17_021512 [Balamuthia mandrillaris]